MSQLKKMYNFIIIPNSTKKYFYASFLNNVLCLLKKFEISVLGGHASTYCYNNPAILQVEITTRCNLMCKMCYRNKLKNFKDMDFGTFKKIVSQVRGLGSIHLFGFGEPLLHKDIVKMIDYCYSRKIPYISITSNGMLLNKGMAERLAESHLNELIVSVDSPNKEFVERTRPGTKLDKVKSNLKYFTSISDIPLGINTIISRENLDDIEGIVDFADEVGAKAIKFRYMKGITKTAKSDYTIGKEQARMLKNKITLLREKCEQRGIKFSLFESIIPDCTAPFFFPYITISGKIVPCCTIEFPEMYDVLEEGFRKAWNCRKIQDWRRKMLKKEFPKPCLEFCDLDPSITNL